MPSLFLIGCVLPPISNKAGVFSIRSLEPSLFPLRLSVVLLLIYSKATLLVCVATYPCSKVYSEFGSLPALEILSVYFHLITVRLPVSCGCCHIYCNKTFLTFLTVIFDCTKCVLSLIQHSSSSLRHSRSWLKPRLKSGQIMRITRQSMWISLAPTGAANLRIPDM